VHAVVGAGGDVTLAEQIVLAARAGRCHGDPPSRVSGRGAA
jgi:hypothetical protein